MSATVLLPGAALFRGRIWSLDIASEKNTVNCSGQFFTVKRDDAQIGGGDSGVQCG